MKRFLTTTTALAVALTSTPPLPLLAQTMDEAGRVIGADGSVLCEPTADAACDLGAVMQQLMDAQAAAAAEAAAAEAAAAEQAAAEAAAAAAAEQAAAEAAAAEAAAAQAAAEQAAAEQAAAEAAAAEQAAAEQAAAEQAAAEAAAAEAAAAEQAAAEAAAAEQAAAEQAAAEQAAAEQAAAEQAAAEQAAAEQAAAEAAAAAEQAAAEAAAAAQAGDEAAAKAAADAQAAAEAAAAEAQAAADAAAAEAQAAAEAVVAPVEPAPAEPVAVEPVPAEPAGTEVTEAAGAPVIVPEPTAEEVEVLETLLAPEPVADGIAETAPTAEAAAIPLLETAPAGETPAPAPDAVATTVTEITEADTRSSAEEFAAAPTAAALAADGGKRRSGLTDLEKVGLIALGALAVGAILKNGDKVETNTGDRVVVSRNDGSYVVYKDDDTLLRRPGATIRTETFRDGSTRTIVDREDGSRVITIRDATGRVLRRAKIDALGRETLLIDDIAPVEPIDVTTLPKPRRPVTISASQSDAALAAAMAAIAAREAARGFSLRQIREIPEVRALAPVIDVQPITFASGSAAIDVTEAEKLAALGQLITQMVAARPGELFLVEGHTDAVGSAASNLSLSDRRAESVALALTEYFGVPPENLVVQGYGESDLLVPTTANEPRNRRVALRLITPLLQAAN